MTVRGDPSTSTSTKIAARTPWIVPGESAEFDRLDILSRDSRQHGDAPTAEACLGSQGAGAADGPGSRHR